MGKQTREERLAAGWVESWGSYCTHSDRWWFGHSPTMGAWGEKNPRGYTRYAWPSLQSAIAQMARNGSDSVIPRRFWRRRKPKAPPVMGHFEVKQCDVLGRWMVCGKCEDRLENLYVRKVLRHKGKNVGDVGVMFNVDEKCRLIRMSIIDRWVGVDL